MTKEQLEKINYNSYVKEGINFVFMSLSIKTKAFTCEYESEKFVFINSKLASKEQARFVKWGTNLLSADMGNYDITD